MSETLTDDLKNLELKSCFDYKSLKWLNQKDIQVS
jgi:hypothetical protein